MPEYPPRRAAVLLCSSLLVALLLSILVPSAEVVSDPNPEVTSAAA